MTASLARESPDFLAENQSSQATLTAVSAGTRECLRCAVAAISAIA